MYRFRYMCSLFSFFFFVTRNPPAPVKKKQRGKFGFLLENFETGLLIGIDEVVFLKFFKVSLITGQSREYLENISCFLLFSMLYPL